MVGRTGRIKAYEEVQEWLEETYVGALKEDMYGQPFVVLEDINDSRSYFTVQTPNGIDDVYPEELIFDEVKLNDIYD